MSMCIDTCVYQSAGGSLLQKSKLRAAIISRLEIGVVFTLVPGISHLKYLQPDIRQEIVNSDITFEMNRHRSYQQFHIVL